MNKIFDFLDYKTLYERCIMASVAHAIMVGEYPLFACEQSRDGQNYNFQNLEGVRGVISFGEEIYVCVTQNSADYEGYDEHRIAELFYGAEEKINKLAEDEALQYVLINHNGDKIPFISTAFWKSGNTNFSNQSEAEIIEHSDNTIIPFLYSESDAKKYWKEYYEMNDEQGKMMEDIYERRIKSKGTLKLTSNEKNKLIEWFDDIDECIESFGEMNILV